MEVDTEMESTPFPTIVLYRDFKMSSSKSVFCKPPFHGTNQCNVAYLQSSVS